MKNLIVLLIAGMGMICGTPKADAKEIRQHESREFKLSSNAAGSILYIYNIDGFIKIEGYDGNSVILEMDKTIIADSEEKLNKGVKEFRLGYDQLSDTILVYIASPYDSRPRRKWHFNDDEENRGYDCSVSFTVKVPRAMNLHVSTVNNGEVIINNVSGSIHASNVNDKITIKNAAQKTTAHTVNGDVTVSYIRNPDEESSFQTINGDINISLKPGLSADMQFKSMNGEMFTDFQDIQKLPATVTKEKTDRNAGTVFKLNSATSIRFGKGGVPYRLETLNGNVYIRKES